MSDTPFSADEIAELRKLLEIEKIKLLYSQLMDSRDVDSLAQIFAENAVCE